MQQIKDKQENKQKDMDVKTRKMQHWQVVRFFLVIYDILAVNAAYFLALWIRFDCRFSAIEPKYWDAYTSFAPIYTVLAVLVFAMCRLYKSIWRFASYSELIYCTFATMICFVIQLFGINTFFTRMPVSYHAFGIVWQAVLIIGVRFAYRFVLLLGDIRERKISSNSRRVMLIGAGNAGQMILRDLHKAKETPDHVCCIIDDDPNKWNRFIDGVPVVGNRDDILSNVEKYKIDKIYLAIPSASAEEKRDILNICNESGCELKQLPGMYQFFTGEVSVGAMKDVSVEDLLGREPIKTNLEEVFQFINGKTIMVTGGGGSIGSELCRQIAGHNPKQLIIFDVYENNAYDIQMELKDKYPKLKLVTLIGSIRDSRRLDQVFGEYKPDVVYHAAAHKHVPLMEDSPCESIKNNVIGTYKTAYAAVMHGCKRFVLISTDKAVNPTNIMGASKRLCEMVIQTFDYMIKKQKLDSLPLLYTHAEEEDGLVAFEGKRQYGATEFVAVRFGNVLGSNGSVIPLFKKQIAAGGPITVTHPDIVRYFMTIPEAVSLVLQAGTYAKGGEIFVLDMGSAVKIDTLARNLIKLSGFKPDVDIKIEYTGLRPGEKLYEEKLMAEEGLKMTDNKLIHIGSPIPFDMDEFVEQLRTLMDASYANRNDIRKLVKDIVPTYQPKDMN